MWVIELVNFVYYCDFVVIYWKLFKFICLVKLFLDVLVWEYGKEVIIVDD